MINQDTIDSINDWATDKYATPAPSLTSAAASPLAAVATDAAPASSGGMLSSGSIGAPAASTAAATAAAPDWTTATATPATTAAAPAAAPAPAAPASAAAPAVDIGSWYTQDIGRTADASGLAYWQGRAAEAGANPDTLRQEFDRQAVVNGEFNKPAAAPAPAAAPTLLDLSTLAHRTIDPATQTVAGQLKSVLATDSPVMQQARADAMRSANERGMLNSAMAASGGEDAAIRSGLQIASPDAGYYNHAADYNAAADNQGAMFNATAQNDFAKQQAQIAADTAARTAQLGQQMTLAQMQDATSRYATETNSATSRYNTDANFRQQAENNKKTLVNNIIGNMDMSPDRKAAMLQALGEGTSAAPGKPGTGLAGAVYVIDSTTADLNFSGLTDQQRAQQAASQAVGNG